MTDTSSIVYIADTVATPVGVPVPAAGAQTVFGQGPPSAAVGADGFYYFDCVALQMYGPRVSGAWPPPWQGAQPQSRGLPLVAGATIPAHASLMFGPDGTTAVLGDPTAPGYVWAGIAAAAAAAGDPVLAVREGIVTDATWTWAAGPLFAVKGGMLTPSAPLTGLYHRVGTALSATKALIASEPVIQRA